MSGKPIKADRLNDTLSLIVKEFHKENLTRWFVSYGTLLGLYRDNSCIDGDDDIDICCHLDDYDIVKDILERLNLGETYKIPPHKVKGEFLRKENSKTWAPVDIYFCRVNDVGDYYDSWEEVTWSNVYDYDESLPSITWNDLKIFVPRCSKVKLQKRYGPTWTKRIKRGAGPKSDGYRKVKVL